MAGLDTAIGVVSVLGPLIEKELNLHLNSEKEAELLKSSLLKIKDMLDDAENKQLTDRAIKKWLVEVKQLAYNIEDALDEWEIKKQQTEGEEGDRANNFWEKVSLFIHSPCSCFNQCLENRQIALDVIELNKRVDGIYDEAENVLKLQRVVNEGSGEPTRVKTGRKLELSSVIESNVRGRDSDRNALKSMLLGHGNDGESSIGKGKMKPIIAIVGVGGVGKSTLAKLVYNDSDVGREFPQRIWVCVSDPFDETRVAREILEGIDGHYPDGIESLMKKIKENIRRKGKFLLVLDDMWTDDAAVWETLNDCLSHGCDGSMILITTRNLSVAQTLCDATHIHKLESLTVKETWSIIEQLALSRRRPEDQQLLKGVGIDIAKKCKGLPLAAKFLGNLLRGKRTKPEWEYVLESEILELENVENEVFGPLFLSYQELEPAVKSCFSYCALFPKDTQIDVDDLIRRWVAQGFIPSGAGGGEMELQGQDYFFKLANQGFFQDFKSDLDFEELVVGCKMHDIVHDFAQYLKKGECFIMQNSGADGDGKASRREEAACRHLWIDGPQSASVPSFIKPERLRSLICRDAVDQFQSLLPSLKYCIKELSLADCGLEEIPKEIGNLVGLRYLDLRGNKMEKVPEEICNLFKLQTLILLNCNALKTLPPMMFIKLKDLRHLIVSEFMQYPRGLEGLKNLRTMSKLIIERGQLNKLGCLKDLNKLGGELSMVLKGLDGESDVVEATNAALEAKEYLRSLDLRYDENVSRDVLAKLQPPSSLKLLSCSGAFFPSWISSITHLRILKLQGSNNFGEASIPSLWILPYLEELHLQGIAGLKHLGREFIGFSNDDQEGFSGHNQQLPEAFPELKTLVISGCSNLEEWEDVREDEAAAAAAGRIKIFPCLHKLVIDGCHPRLKLPLRILQHVASLLDSLKIYCKENQIKVEGEEAFNIPQAKHPFGSLRQLYCEHLLFPRLITAFTNIKNVVLCEFEVEGGAFNILPLWKMPFLEELHFRRVLGLKILGREFIGLSSDDQEGFTTGDNQQEHVAFPKLKMLRTWGCINLREWEDIREDEAREAAVGRIKIFPCLRKLEIIECHPYPKLPIRIFQHLESSLEYLKISCEQRTLRLSIDKGVFPDVFQAKHPSGSLRELFCYGILDPRLISAFTYLRKVDLCKVEEEGAALNIQPLWKMSFLEELSIRRGFGMKHLGVEILGLRGTASHALTDANQDAFDDDHHRQDFHIMFPMLQKLKFNNCQNWHVWEDISEEDAQALAAGRFKIMPHISSLTITDCRFLEALPERLLNHIASSLQHLDIRQSEKLLSFYKPVGGNWDKISRIPHIQY